MTDTHRLLKGSQRRGAFDRFVGKTTEVTIEADFYGSYRTDTALHTRTEHLYRTTAGCWIVHVIELTRDASRGLLLNQTWDIYEVEKEALLENGIFAELGHKSFLW